MTVAPSVGRAMTQTTFQTVVLGAGKHRCPEVGACVVELACTRTATGHERALALVDELVAIGPEHHPDRVMRLGAAGRSMARSPIPAHEPKEQP